MCLLTCEEPRSEVIVIVSALTLRFPYILSQDVETEIDYDTLRGRIAQNVFNFLITSLAACAFMQSWLPLLHYYKEAILRERWQASSWNYQAVNHSSLILALPLTATHHFLALWSSEQILCA